MTRTEPEFWHCGRCGTPNPRASYLTRCLACGRPAPPDLGPAPAPAGRRAPGRPGGRGRWVAIGALYYGTFLVCSWAAMRTMALSWWAVPVLLFLPRWLFLGPVALLAAGAARARDRRSVAMVGLVAWLVVGPLMGFAIPWGRPASGAPAGPRVRVLSFNRAGRPLGAREFLRYLERERVDVVCFQEPGANPEVDAYFAEGWHLDHRRMIASRFPIVAEIPDRTARDESDERSAARLARIRVRHPDGFEFVVGSVHMPTVRRAYVRLRARDLDGLRRHLAWWDREAGRVLAALAGTGPVPMILGGDFNMPAEYATMAEIRSTCPSAFDRAGWGFGYTRPASSPWVRIDHVLGSRHWAFTRCRVGPDLGSDHLPILAEAALVARP